MKESETQLYFYDFWQLKKRLRIVCWAEKEKESGKKDIKRHERERIKKIQEKVKQSRTSSQRGGTRAHREEMILQKER